MQTFYLYIFNVGGQDKIHIVISNMFWVSFTSWLIKVLKKKNKKKRGNVTCTVKEGFEKEILFFLHD
jgi:hypothetical protein